MKKNLSQLLLLYYILGIFCLPIGNFAEVVSLSEMYRHCKATEDKDMTVVDFFTDHLINVDGIFDKHKNGDEQKPHHPTNNTHFQLDSGLIKESFVIKPILYFFSNKSKIVQSESFYVFNNPKFIFRPPIYFI